MLKATRTGVAITDRILQSSAHKQQQPSDSSSHFTTNMYLWKGSHKLEKKLPNTAMPDFILDKHVTASTAFTEPNLMPRDPSTCSDLLNGSKTQCCIRKGKMVLTQFRTNTTPAAKSVSYPGTVAARTYPQIRRVVRTDQNLKARPRVETGGHNETCGQK